MAVRANHLVPAVADSPLDLRALELAPGERGELTETERDTLLFVVAGRGSLQVGGSAAELAPRDAALVLAGEDAVLEAGPDDLQVVQATVGSEADRHAPLGTRDLVVSLDDAGSEKATGARSFQLLFGPHNGSTRATLFGGFIPRGRAPWHYHLYDEIVWVLDGPGRLHLGGAATDLGPGSAFRLRPREVHIVENASDETGLAVLGVFTPAGSPSAAYLTPDVAAEYRFAG